MNANQIINMVVRMVMRKLIRSGVNAGMDAVGTRMNKGKRGQAQGQDAADGTNRVE